MANAVRRLIVNADDFGQTLGISRGIIDAHKQGIVTSATLMVNSEYAEETVHLLHSEESSLPLGLHLNLTFGTPVCDSTDISSLVDSRGKFPATFPPDLLSQRYTVDIEQQVDWVLARLSARAEEVERELRFQLQRFTNMVGCLPTHLDSHHHIHKIPAIFEIVADIAREYRLPVRQISPAMRKQLRSRGIVTTDFFIGDFWGALNAISSLEQLKAALEILGEGTTEMMCHPGYVDTELLQTSLYSHQREREMHLVCSSELRQYIIHHGIELISPVDLCENG